MSEQPQPVSSLPRPPKNPKSSMGSREEEAPVPMTEEAAEPPVSKKEEEKEQVEEEVEKEEVADSKRAEEVKPVEVRLYSSQGSTMGVSVKLQSSQS